MSWFWLAVRQIVYMYQHVHSNTLSLFNMSVDMVSRDKSFTLIFLKGVSGVSQRTAIFIKEKLKGIKQSPLPAFNSTTESICLCFCFQTNAAYLLFYQRQDKIRHPTLAPPENHVASTNHDGLGGAMEIDWNTSVCLFVFIPLFFLAFHPSIHFPLYFPFSPALRLMRECFLKKKFRAKKTKTWTFCLFITPKQEVRGRGYSLRLVQWHHG